MRTTINIDDQLLQSAKHLAVEQGISLARVIENALRESLSKPKSSSEPIQLITATGSGIKPGVDLDKNRSLQDIMDE